MSMKSAVDWASFCREVLLDAFLDNPEQIGGHGHTVEIDESKFGKCKYHRGHRVEGAWVFGGVDRQTGRVFMEVVEYRKFGPLRIYEIGYGFVPFPLPDRPLPSKIRFSDLHIAYIDHSVIAFLRANHQTFDKRGINLKLMFPSSDDTDGPPIWDVFLVSIDSCKLLPEAIGADFDGPNATISAGQALSKWLHIPRKDGQPKRLRYGLADEQGSTEWINNFKEHFLRATISSVSYEIHFFVRVPSIQMVPFELVNELTKEKLTLAIENVTRWDKSWIMNRCKFGEAVAVQQQKKLDEKWINNCNNVSFWLDIGINCIGPLSAPPSAEEDEEAGQCITKGASSADNE
ncbi:hypothetical protein niasHT_017893 [Heterodera trifolii]|uniref:Transposase n=1 Tax=Heterodera trifolii TaxID=157864 RepID=A0ABD2LFE1_9BILA